MKISFHFFKIAIILLNTDSPLKSFSICKGCKFEVLFGNLLERNFRIFPLVNNPLQPK